MKKIKLMLSERNIKFIPGAFLGSSESIGKTMFGLQQNIKLLNELKQKGKIK